MQKLENLIYFEFTKWTYFVIAVIFVSNYRLSYICHQITWGSYYRSLSWSLLSYILFNTRWPQNDRLIIIITVIMINYHMYDVDMNIKLTNEDFYIQSVHESWQLVSHLEHVWNTCHWMLRKQQAILTYHNLKNYK